MCIKLLSENIKGGDHLRHLKINGKAVFQWIFRVQWTSDVAQDKVECQALVNTEMKH
jgi:hypothetical protein